jgi:hypothetical protein
MSMQPTDADYIVGRLAREWITESAALRSPRETDMAGETDARKP